MNEKKGNINKKHLVYACGVKNEQYTIYTS